MIRRALAAASVAAFTAIATLRGGMPTARAASVTSLPPILFVPLDDRPVTLQLPILLGRVAGRTVLAPPSALVGRYLAPGDGAGILRWLRSPAAAGADALIASTDMIAYGGLVASRVPGVSAADAGERLAELGTLKRDAALDFVGAFGTVMRLAPTGVPRQGLARDYYATGATVDDIQAYANLPDPPATPENRRKAAALRAWIGPATLDAYLATRRRNLAVDERALAVAAGGGFDRLVIGQDDAGPVGLHLRDVAALERLRRDVGAKDVAAIEPGADELGMVLLGRALARDAGWAPSIRVVYSRPGGGALEDRLEFAPIDVTIARLIAASGARRVERGADVTLYVRVAGTPAAAETAFEDTIAGDVAAGRAATVADLTFLAGEPGPEQRELAEALVARGVAGRLDGFASWNTNANTVGTALGAALAVGAGRRLGRYDAHAHAEFVLDRFIDDYAFHQFVRPPLNATFRALGADTTLLDPELAREAAAQNRADLWPLALDLLHRIYPGYTDAGLIVTLPWDRTFETRIDVRLVGGSPA